MNKVAVNIHLQAFVWTWFLAPLDKYQEVQLQALYVVLSYFLLYDKSMFHFVRNSQIAFQSAMPFCIPTAVYECSCCSISLPAFDVIM